MCPEKGNRAVRALEHTSDGGQLRELGWGSLEQRKLRGDLTALYNCLKGDGGDGVWPLLPGKSARMRGDGIKLYQERFRLDIRKHFFSERTVLHWHSCSASGGLTVPGDVYKRVHAALWATVSERGGDQDYPAGQLHHGLLR